MSVQEEIISTIETMVTNYLDKHHKTSQTKIVSSVIADVNHNRYKINLNGSDYWIKNGTDAVLYTGTPVWVLIPNGVIGDMFIMAKK